MVASVQAISPIHTAIINCVRTWVVFACPNPREAQLAAKILGGPPELAEIIQRLPKRHFVMWSEGFEGPIFGITPTINTGARPTDETIAEHMRPILEEIDKKLILSPPFDDEEGNAPITFIEDDEPDVAQPSERKEPPLPDSPETIALYVRFLTAVASNQHHSTRALNAALGISPGKSTRLRTDLIANGYILVRKEPVKTGRPRLIVQIEPKGREFLAKRGATP
jgi:hypothetical protein